MAVGLQEDEKGQGVGTASQEGPREAAAVPAVGGATDGDSGAACQSCTRP